jgi:Holliday junction resolvase RusA-like endonuclease
MEKINIKPLSVNDAFKGRRFKTDKYKSFENEMLFSLPIKFIGIPPYIIKLEFGFSSKASDIDNPVKQTIDCLSKKYKFNDNQVYRLEVEKFIVDKGNEYIKFDIIEKK